MYWLLKEDYEFQWNGFNFNWGTWLVGAENRGCKVKGSWSQEQNRRRRGQQKEKGDGIENNHQREKDGVREADLLIWKSG